MNITLTNPKTIVLQEAKTKTIDTLTVNRVVDLPKQKIVRCFVEELDEAVTLWEGASYDSIGQWSDADVQNRLTALFNTPGATA